jgi:hypothetical protein
VFFAVVRLPPSRCTATFALPAWCFAGLKPGTRTTVMIEDAALYRAKARPRIPHFIDWLDYVSTREYFPTAHPTSPDRVLLWSRPVQPFELVRHVHVDDAEMFAARTTTNAGQRGWSFITADRTRLDEMRGVLARFGIEDTRQVYTYSERRKVHILRVRRSKVLLRLARRYKEKGRGG